MKILALDQATKITGYSIWDNDQLVEYGEINKKDTNVVVRMRQMYFSIEQIIKRTAPDFVCIEGVQKRNNPKVHSTLSQLQGILFALCFKFDLGFCVVDVSSWKSLFGVKSKHGDEQKKETQKIVYDKFHIEVGEDTADSIGIGYWAIKNLKVKED